jgi:hypothetical protein
MRLALKPSPGTSSGRVWPTSSTLVCASTAAMIHLAYMSLLSKEIGMAVAGTTNVLSYA